MIKCCFIQECFSRCQLQISQRILSLEYIEDVEKIEGNSDRVNVFSLVGKELRDFKLIRYQIGDFVFRVFICFFRLFFTLVFFGFS